MPKKIIAPKETLEQEEDPAPEELVAPKKSLASRKSIASKSGVPSKKGVGSKPSVPSKKGSASKNSVPSKRSSPSKEPVAPEEPIAPTVRGLEPVGSAKGGSSKKLIAILLALVVVLGLGAAALVMLTPSEPPVPPEETLRKLVADCVKAVNGRSVSSIMEATADDFVGPQGISKQQLQMGLLGQVLRNPDLAQTFNPKTEVRVASENAATVISTLVLSRTRAPSLEQLPRGNVAAIYRVTARLERREGKWRFVAAQYDILDAW